MMRVPWGEGTYGLHVTERAQHGVSQALLASWFQAPNLSPRLICGQLFREASVGMLAPGVIRVRFSCKSISIALSDGVIGKVFLYEIRTMRKLKRHVTGLAGFLSPGTVAVLGQVVHTGGVSCA